MVFKRTLPKHLMPEIAPEDNGSVEFDGRCKTCEHSQGEGDTYWCGHFLRNISKAESWEGCRGYVKVEDKDDDEEEEM
jgi:hypothetical protein